MSALVRVRVSCRAVFRVGVKFRLRGMLRVTVSVRVSSQEVLGSELLAVQWSPRRAVWRLHGSVPFRLSLSVPGTASRVCHSSVKCQQPPCTAPSRQWK